MNSKMYFYCPECGKEIEEFKFKNEKEEKLLKTWTNIRDGYGQPIRHIKCPQCGNVLSGLMNYRSYGEIDEKQYFKNVIELYNRERKDGGCIENGKLKALKKNIEDDYNIKVKEMNRAEEMIKIGKRCVWRCCSCGEFMRFDDYIDKPDKCKFCGSKDIV